MAMTDLDTKLTKYAPVVLSVFRIVFGLLFTLHGTQKLFGFPSATSSGTVAAGTWPYWYAGVLEVVLGLLILTGLFTRIAAFIASGEMAYAFFSAHFPKAFWPIDNGGEPSVLFCFGFLLLVFTGGGAIALDNVIRRKSAAPAV
ncbi:DoxX family protein [Mycolicibacterium diernhoferi]|uniref:DoxX family protein n=2 Tax=Mycolicibacterium diernhoferi TaxID=1801 RepID=A0A1Q4HMA0_9MYCO|nr:DoxX family protein [Mycolicibacterium diernhoferi]OJZ68552.1 phosphoribosylaminoimidazolecarboxamide formyltransferase [Mycolicibacterium diernhoferi]PEG54429.1 DoxX family protein [Mycolicibacterium diernhoferi]QYL20948.1 DoxX family protein [Mycolicibacterium diernhoferi]